MTARKKRKLKDYAVSYSFLLPFAVLFCIFIVYPILRVMTLSLYNGNFLDKKFTFIGFTNYINIFHDSNFIRAFKNTCLYMLMEVPACQILALTLALLIKKNTRSSKTFEVVFFLPMLVSMVVASVLISYIISYNGPVNQFLSIFGVSRQSFLQGVFSAKVCVLFLELWKGGTFFVFVYMSAMRSISYECIESARLDGANALQEAFYIIFPLIRNTIILCVTMNTIWQFQIYDSVYMLTGGGPLGTTETIIYQIYNYSFKYYRVGYGAAAAVMFLLFVLVIYLIENLLLSDKDERRERREIRRRKQK